MPTESASSSRLLRRLGVLRWVAVFTAVLAGAAVLLPWSNLVMMLAICIVAVGGMVTAVVLDRRVVALGGRSAYPPKDEQARLSPQERE